MLYLFLGSLIILLYLNYLDAKTTYFVVSKCGFKSEKNPLARLLIKKFGAKKGILILKLIIIFIIPLIIWCYFESPKSIIIVLFILNIFYLFVVVQNYKVCEKVIE